MAAPKSVALGRKAARMVDPLRKAGMRLHRIFRKNESLWISFLLALKAAGQRGVEEELPYYNNVARAITHFDKSEVPPTPTYLLESLDVMGQSENRTHDL